MNPGWLSQIPVSTVSVVLTPRHSWHLPSVPAVMVRGALGLAMMDLLCVRAHQTCVGCDRISSCLIPQWFDPGRGGGQALRPAMVVSEGRPGALFGPHRPLSLRFLVVGALPRPSLWVEALFRMAAQGLGANRIEHQLSRLEVFGDGEGVTVVEDGAVVAGVEWPPPGTLAEMVQLPERVTGAQVKVITPLQWRGAAPHVSPSVGDLVKAAIDRARSVARDRGVQIDRWWPMPGEITGQWTEADWIDGGRYSQRQGLDIDLSGWVGTIELDHSAAAIDDLLAAAAIFSVGRNTSAGAGRLRITWYP